MEENSDDIYRCTFCAQYEQTQNTHGLLTAAIRSKATVKAKLGQLNPLYHLTSETTALRGRGLRGLRSDNADFAQERKS